jgi:hypothetical protein
MRPEMTMSDSGPVPRSHSPLVCVKLSRFIRGFLLSEQVSKAGGFLEGFRIHGLPQSLTQFDQFRKRRRIATPVQGALADVALGAVNALEERLQPSPEDGVIVRASQSAFRAKFHVLDAASRADQPRQLVAQLTDVLSDQRMENGRQI